jgi:hypothetical protein
MEIMRYKGDGCNRKLFILITQSKIMIIQPDGKIVETRDDCIYVHSPNGTTTKHSAKDLAILTNCPVEDQWSPKKYDFREALTRTRDNIQSVLDE